MGLGGYSGRRALTVCVLYSSSWPDAIQMVCRTRAKRRTVRKTFQQACWPIRKRASLRFRTGWQVDLSVFAGRWTPVSLSAVSDTYSHSLIPVHGLSLNSQPEGVGGLPGFRRSMSPLGSCGGGLDGPIFPLLQQSIEHHAKNAPQGALLRSRSGPDPAGPGS